MTTETTAQSPLTASEIIDEFGGTQEVADLLEITTGAVSQWRTNGLPDARLKYFKLLRPEFFEGREVA